MSLLPWYIAGPLIGLMVPILLIAREKQLGLSSTYRYLGSFILPRNSYFNYDRKKDAWQVQFAIGIASAAILIFQFDLYESESLDSSKEYLRYFPEVCSLQNWFMFAIGGIFVGFGARYAGGCTAGHCIMGNSQLSVSSILSTCMFFAGGLAVSHFILPYLFKS
ncbi:MAG: YeeE/YedE thiosulfate transporter family protein [Crocinitomicaceae bacterium]|nr:YeeE/YedE thiosulfate transporter family protein [Crocinitomicaceae bacterium]